VDGRHPLYSWVIQRRCGVVLSLHGEVFSPFHGA
jgi:hypothetical protein